MKERGVAILSVVMIAVSGCATIPPAAQTHLNRLADYQEKTTKGTLAACDTLTKGLEFTIDRVRETTREDWNNYIGDAENAAATFGTLRNSLEQTIFLRSLAGDPNGVAARRINDKLDATLAAMLKQIQEAEQRFAGYAKTAKQTKEKDDQGRMRLTFTLPDPAVLSTMAESLARLVAFAGKPGT